MLASSDPLLSDILARCRAGDPTGQQALYARFARPMMSVCARYVRVPEEAQDVLQDAFVKVFLNLAEYRGEGPFEAWLRRIVVNTALRAVRKMRQLQMQESVDDYHHLPTPDASALEHLTLAEVQDLIDLLPEGSRLVLLLYAIEGYSHAEIGQILGCSESSSSAQLARARQRLGGLLQAQARERVPSPPPPAANEPTAREVSARPLSAPPAPIPLLANLLFQ